MVRLSLSHNADLDEEIYMSQPPGLPPKLNAHGNEMVLKLHKSIYGLKQAYIYLCRRGEILDVIALYVDDLQGATNNEPTWNVLKSKLSSRLKMKDLGVASYCLGLEISQDLEAGTVRISQRKYFESVLERFGMSDCRPVSTLFPVGTKLNKVMSPKTHEERELMLGKDYLGGLGCIMYGMLGTRADVAYVVGVLSLFSSNPGIEHWNALMHLLRYIKGTLHLRITYRGLGRLKTLSPTLWCAIRMLIGLERRTNCSRPRGRLFSLQGGGVSWISRLQGVAAQSNMEAEYIASSHSGRELMFVRNLVGEISLDRPTPMHCDNQSTITVAENPAMHDKAKHMALKYHNICDYIEDRDVTIH